MCRCKASAFSKEIYKATALTIKSTVESIKYLLQKRFHIVLTKKSDDSDDIEAFFAYIRRLGGSNNMRHVTASSDSITKVLNIRFLKARNQLAAPVKKLTDSKDLE